jgi:uncharacterized membrane protein YccC
MWQIVIVYVIVAAAASWVAWHVLMPSAWRNVLRAHLDSARGRVRQARSGACACERERS